MDRFLRQLGRYVLFEELGRGGSGHVYLARMRGEYVGYERVVAVKTIQRNAEDDASWKGFLDEVRITSRLSHPNVASVIDFGQADDQFWLAMDYIQGLSVSELVRIPVPEHAAPRLPLVAAQLVADACEGLHAAHELLDSRGEPLHVAHRDVSPKNLIAGFDGITRVVDFGIANASNRWHLTTAAGHFRGSLGYASPEHIQGAGTDRRTDIWSLGVVLWELCARRRLFDSRDPIASIDATLHAPIPALAEESAHVPRGLDEIVWKCLQRDRARRFATARELGSELRLVLAEHLDVLGPADVARFLEEVAPERREADDAQLRRIHATPLDLETSTAPRYASRIPSLRGLVLLVVLTVAVGVVLGVAIDGLLR